MTNNEITEENEAEEKTNLSHTVLCADGKTKVISNYTRSLAIKLKCMGCINWEGHPKDCIDKICPLYPFRDFTTVTKSSVIVEKTEEQKKFLNEKMAKMREKQKENKNKQSTAQNK